MSPSVTSMRMTCAEFREACAAGALEMLEGEERAAFEAHLGEPGPHEGCTEALAAARATVEELPFALEPMKPSPDVWRAIERGLMPASVSSIAGASASKVATAPSVPRRGGVARVAPWLLAAASLALVAWLGVSLQEQSQGATAATARAEKLERSITEEKALRVACDKQLETARNELELRQQAVALLGMPSTHAVALAPTPGSASVEMGAMALVNTQRNEAVLVASGMAAPDGKDYELWVIHGDEKRPAGLLRAAGNPTMIARIDSKLLAGAEAFAVTLEPAGGGSAPQGPIVLVGAMPKT